MKNSLTLRAILKPEAQQMLARFSSLLNVRIGFFGPDGSEICIGEERPICTFCKMLRSNDESRCFELDKKMFERAKLANKPFSYPCHGGLTEAFVPVDLAEKRIGLIMVGQFRAEGQTAPPSCSDGMLVAYENRPIFSQKQISDMLGLVELMVQSFVDRQLVTSADTDQIQLLLDRIHENPAKTMTVEEAAIFTCRSPSSIAHLFKNLTGKSIRQYQIEAKLDEADRLLRTFPDMPIKEIAERLGFDDPLYFSRLYRKHRNSPPSATRKRRSD